MTLLFLQKQLFTIAPQNSYYKKACKSRRKKTVMEFFFSKVAGCHLTKKGLHCSLFISGELCEILQTSFFLKNLRANISVPFRPFQDFTGVLNEVTLFFRVNFDSCPCTALPQHELFGLLNKYRFLICSHSELFCEIALPKKIGIYVANV